jgi:hypothetical protein
MFTPEFRESLMESYWEGNLKGGVTTSEFAIYMARDAETAFVSGAELSAILAACATIETYLRTELIGEIRTSATLAQLIEKSEFPADLKTDLERLRLYRNRWVHVRDPAEDKKLLEHPGIVEAEIAEYADLAVRSMIRAICSNP